jgi:hypothetical protein
MKRRRIALWEGQPPPDQPYLYVFSVPTSHLIKIGATKTPTIRLAGLRHQKPRHEPHDRKAGRFLTLIPMPSMDHAKWAENLVRRLLHSKRLNLRPEKPQYGVRIEWFDVSPETMLKAAAMAAGAAEGRETRTFITMRRALGIEFTES